MPTREEIEEWEEKHDAIHPAFRVEHRPERVTPGEPLPNRVDWATLRSAVERTDNAGNSE